MAYKVSYVTADYDNNNIIVYSQEPIYCFENLNLSSIVQGIKNSTLLLSSTELNALTASSGDGMTFAVDPSSVDNFFLFFSLPTELRSLSTECLITGYEVEFEYLETTSSAITRFSINNANVLSINESDFVESNYINLSATYSWTKKNWNFASGCMVNNGETVLLSFETIPLNYYGAIIKIRNMKIKKLYYIPRCILSLSRFNNIEQYCGIFKSQSSSIINLYNLNNNNILSSSEIDADFTATSYSYNNNLYSFDYINWRLNSLDPKLTSVSGASGNAKISNLLQQQGYPSGVGTNFDKDFILYLVEPTLLNYTITYNYNSNGVTNTYEDTATPNSTYTIFSNEVLYENANSLDPSKNIAGWTETQGSSVITYTPESTFTITKNTVLYAVWEDRDSVTINPSVANITIVSFDITPSAQNGLTYYFNRGLNKKVTLSIDLTVTGSVEYYIHSVSGAMGTIAPVGQRSWTGNDVVNTGSTAVSTTINITYHKNLILYFFLDAIEKDKLLQPNFSTEFFIGGNELLQELTNTTEENYNYKYKTKYLNPGDSITHTVSCINNNYYISKIFSPNITGSNYQYDGSPGVDELQGSLVKKRADLKNGYNGNNISVSITNNSCTSLTYTFTVPTGSNGVALMGDDTGCNIQNAYVVYEPFHCQYQINNYNYILNMYEDMGYHSDEDYLVIQDTSAINGERHTIKFFNDISINPLYYVEAYRDNNTTKHVISGISSQDSDLTLNNYLTSVLFNNLASSGNYNGFSLESDRISVAGYSLNNFTGWKVHPTQYMLNNYHIPYVIDVTWNNNDYKCFIILKLPETQENEANISNATEFNTSGWTNILDSSLNRNIYIKEITNISSTTSINASLKDVVNAGYILKQIDKYTFDGTYNSDCTTSTNHITVTREQLDSGTNLQNWTRTSPDSSGSNDKLSFNKIFSSADSGIVDYYFITYEEGLPIFYPDDENDPKRAIQLFWEGTRAIGLYYENTRLL